MELYKALCEISGEGNVLKDEPMKMHTTFRIGGPADYFIQPSKIEEIRRIVAVCRECSTPYYIMGNGSNLLVGDKGFRGVIVQVFKHPAGGGAGPGGRVARGAPHRRYGPAGRGRLLLHRGPQEAVYQALRQPGGPGRGGAAACRPLPGHGLCLRGEG